MSASSLRRFLVVALFAALGLLPHAAKAHDPNLEGVRLRQNGQIIVEVWQGIRTGTLSAPLGVWGNTIDIAFLDPDYHEYWPTDPTQTLTWFIPNTAVLQSQQVGQWAVQLQGMSTGSTTYAVVVWHVDHTAFYSGDIPTTVVNVTDAPVLGAARFGLVPPAPNPARGSTNITFHLDRTAPVQLAVFDLLGRRVADLRDGVLASGSQSVPWNTQSFPAGVYFVRLESQGRVEVEKLTIAE